MDFLSPGNVNEVGYGDVSVGELQKALSAGYGTDSAAMAGGRALIPQDIESSVVNALAVKENDFKLTNMLKKDKVSSTVHEFTRRNDAGEWQNLFVSEGGESGESSQDIERASVAMKYLQTYREVTLQMQVSRTLEDAVAGEKTSGILTLLKGLEGSLFSADSAVVPQQFDSITKQVKTGKKTNVFDMGGKKITDSGENAINEIARMVYDNGGSLTNAFMPSVLAADLQAVMRDRLRFGPADTRMANVAEVYPTQFGDIKIAGKAGGADKMFRIKGPVSASGDPARRPAAPTFWMNTEQLGSNAAASGIPAGTYFYTVHAVNQYGISPASAPASVAVQNGNQVKLTVTAGDSVTTGYIICRSKAGGTGDKTAEMCRIASAGNQTVYLDQNADIPGTGEILLLSHDELEPTVSLGQLLPVMKFDLYPTKAAIIPFLICMFCAPIVRVPWYHGVIKNISYEGNIYA